METGIVQTRCPSSRNPKQRLPTHHTATPRDLSPWWWGDGVGAATSTTTTPGVVAVAAVVVGPWWVAALAPCRQSTCRLPNTTLCTFNMRTRTATTTAAAAAAATATTQTQHRKTSRSSANNNSELGLKTPRARARTGTAHAGVGVGAAQTGSCSARGGTELSSSSVVQLRSGEGAWGVCACVLYLYRRAGGCGAVGEG